MILRERETPEGLLVSVCDRGLLGETFEGANASLTVSEEFYDGEHADPPAVVDSLERAVVANIVGVEAVNLAVEHGFVQETQVLELDGTLHAQMLRIG